MADAAIDERFTGAIRFIAGPERKVIVCHKFPLSRLSAVFYTMFKKIRVDTVSITYLPSDVVHKFLLLMHYQKIDTSALTNLHTAWGIYTLFYKFQVIDPFFNRYKINMTNALYRYPREVLKSFQCAYYFCDKFLIHGMETYLMLNCNALLRANVESLKEDFLLILFEKACIRVSSELVFLDVLNRHQECHNRMFHDQPQYEETMRRKLLSHIRFLTLNPSDLQKDCFTKSPVLTPEEKAGIAARVGYFKSDVEYPEYFSQVRVKRQIRLRDLSKCEAVQEQFLSN